VRLGLRARLLFVALLGLAPAAEAFVWPSAPAKIARALESGDVAERRAAALKIADMGPGVAGPLLVKALGDPDVEVKLNAARSAIRLRHVAAADAVIPWLSDSEVRVRLAACEVIRYSPSRRAVLALGRVLGDPDPAVRLAAAEAIGAAGIPEAVGPLLGHLDDPAPAVRAEVAQALARIGDATAAVPLIGKVGDSAPEVRRAVARALGELGDPRAGSALVLALRDGVASVRVEALHALGRLASEEAVVAISPLLDEHETPEVRAAALAALGRIGSDGAVRQLIKALAGDDFAAPSSPVRDALQMSGSRALPLLRVALSDYATPGIAAGAALTLGALKAPGACPLLVDAMRRGSLGAHAGLRALAMLGDPAAVPAVSEMLSDPNGAIRRQAIGSLALLLDPSGKDGRAVEPLAAALRDAKGGPEDKEALARALGRTGSPRALEALLPLAKSGLLSLRLSAIDALGTLGPAGQDQVLFDALSDENGSVRLHAALGLAQAANAKTAGLLLERLTAAAVDDRGAIGLALSGALSRSSDPAIAGRIEVLLGTAGDGVRDALIEGLGRMPIRAAGAVLIALVRRGSDAGDRRKIAEALAGHPDRLPELVRLFDDADPGVRANAVWSTGVIASVGSSSPPGLRLDTMLRLVPDPEGDVAANSAAAAALIGRRLGQAGDAAGRADAARALCKALGDFRPYVRANAIAGLGILGARCGDGARERDLLAHDPSEIVRRAVAHALRVAHAEGSPTADRDDRRALSRCAADDKSGRVASACGAAYAVPTGSSATAVFVVPDGRSSPVPLAPFALVRADDLIRSGLADRRGALLELAAPTGPLSLAVPGALSF
jgi:HEAT repeat protein